MGRIRCNLNVIYNLLILDNYGPPGSLVSQGSIGIALCATLAHQAYNTHALRFGGPSLLGWDAEVTFHPQYTKFGAAKLPSAGMGLQKSTPESLTESSFSPLPQGTIL